MCGIVESVDKPFCLERIHDRLNVLARNAFSFCNIGHGLLTVRRQSLHDRSHRRTYTQILMELFGQCFELIEASADLCEHSQQEAFLRSHGGPALLWSPLVESALCIGVLCLNDNIVVICIA